MKSIKLFLLLCLPFFFGACMKQDIQENEKEYLITASSFSEYSFAFSNVDSTEVFVKEKYYDGGTIYSYDFDAVDENEQTLFISNTVTIEPKSSDALITYKAEGLGVSIGIGDAETQKLDSLFSYGDESSFELLKNEGGDLVGNIFRFRKGKVCYNLFIVGVYFNTKSAWEDFIQPQLTTLDILD
jgi:hypothetical protein